MDERRPLLERWADRLLARPYRDVHGSKGVFTRLARAQPHVVARYSLALAGWPRFSRPLRIAFLSDFHVGSHTDDIARLGSIVSEAATCDPDVVLLGGDYVNMQFVSGGRVPPETIATLLAPIVGRHGRFAVLGNHDYVYGAEAVTRALAAQDIAVIDHARSSFSFEGHDIDVVGLPDAHFMRPQARALLEALDPCRPALVLAHDPVWFGEVPRGPYLTLSGHTHGGQIKLPGLGVIHNASNAPLRWSHGLTEEDGRHLIVTAGLGTSCIPLRIGVPPEYAVIDVNGVG